MTLYARLAAVLAAIVILTGIGWKIHHTGVVSGRAEVQAKWDAQERAAAEARAADARQQVKFSDHESGQHAEQVASINTKLGAAYAQIARLSDRPCLSGDTARMLSTTTGVLDGATAASEPESAPAAAASGSGLRYSTERDVAGYIALCRTRYAEVADQLNRILDIEDRRYPPAP